MAHHANHVPRMTPAIPSNTLSAKSCRINLQRAMSSAEPTTILPYLKESDGLVDRILQQVRHLSLDLRPSVLDDLGLVAAVRWSLDRTCRRAGLLGQVAADPPEFVLPSEIAIAGFRIVQEALTNVVRHASAHRVEISLSTTGDHLELVVRDDGIGFDVAAERQGAGLHQMNCNFSFSELQLFLARPPCLCVSIAVKIRIIS